jgi:hypothetical protein
MEDGKAFDKERNLFLIHRYVTYKSEINISDAVFVLVGCGAM